jgi:hypothetical protein
MLKAGQRGEREVSSWDCVHEQEKADVTASTLTIIEGTYTQERLLSA